MTSRALLCHLNLHFDLTALPTITNVATFEFWCLVNYGGEEGASLVIGDFASMVFTHIESLNGVDADRLEQCREDLRFDCTAYLVPIQK